MNSFVTRAIKKMMISTKEQGKDTTLFVVGEKGRSQLSRIHADVSRRGMGVIARKSTLSHCAEAVVWTAEIVAASDTVSTCRRQAPMTHILHFP